MIRTIINRTVRKTIQNADCNSELKKAFLNAPRLNALVSHIEKQVNIANMNLGKKGLSVKRSTLEQTVKDFITGKIELVERASEERTISDAEKSKRMKPVEEEKEMNRTLEGHSEGIYDDMGLEIPLEQQENQENPINSPLKEGRVITYGKGSKKEKGSTH